MRKSIVYSAFLSSALAASGAFANDAAMQPAPAKNPCHMGGFYIGATVGYGSHKAKTDQVLTSAVPLSAQHKNDLSLDGANGGLFLGYGKEFGGSRVYLGLEFGYFMDGSKGKREYVTPAAAASPGDLLKTEAKRKDGLELAARMGLIFNQTMPYIKLGWANTKVEATQVVLADNATAATDTLTQKFLNKRLNGFLVGAGIDMKLNRNLIAGLEYTFATYQKKGSQQLVRAAGVAIGPANNWDSKLKLSDNKFRLRLAYQF